MRANGERGFTLVEIMIVVAIIALLAAIAIPNVLRGRTTANESASIGNLRALMSSLEMFRSVNNTYPADWQANMYTDATPDFGPPSFNVAMSGDTIQGYNYTYAPEPDACSTDCTQYTVLAIPQTANTTGTRVFMADETGVVRHCTGDTATIAQMDGEGTIDQPSDACDGS